MKVSGKEGQGEIDKDRDRERDRDSNGNRVTGTVGQDNDRRDCDR